MRTWQHLPDPTHVYAALAAAVVAQDNTGEPVWVLIVAPPSSGKTESVRLLDNLTDAHLDEVTIGGLLTWTRKAKRAVPAGVLTRVTTGLLTLGDLSTLLATSDRGGRDQVFAALRRIYDGSLVRDIAPPGGIDTSEPLAWQGRLTVVGAVTGAIDNYSAHADALGARWLYIRLPERGLNARKQASRLASRGQLAENRDEARTLATKTVNAGRHALDRVTVSGELTNTIEDAAIVCAYGRGAVPRHGYGNREIDGPATVEEPFRLIRQLTSLARGLLALGFTDTGVKNTVIRCALDSMPAARRAVLDALVDDPGNPTTAGLARHAGLNRGVTRRTLEELEAIGAVEAERKGDDPPDDARDLRPASWYLADDIGELIRTVARPRWCPETWGHHTTTPQESREEDNQPRRHTPHTSRHLREDTSHVSGHPQDSR